MLIESVIGGVAGAALFHLGRWAYARHRSRAKAVEFAEMMPGALVEELGANIERDRRFRVRRA